MLTDGVISQQRQRRRIVTASVEATKGRDMTETYVKRQSGLGDAEAPGVRQIISEVKHSC